MGIFSNILNRGPDYPDWLSRDREKPNHFEVDLDKAYPLFLKHLGVLERDWNQYWLEIAYNCMKLAVQDWVTINGVDPRPERTLMISMRGAEGYKERWGLKHRPVGPEYQRLIDIYGADAWREVARETKTKHWPRIRRNLL